MRTPTPDPLLKHVKELVAIDSQGDKGDYTAIVESLTAWMTKHRIDAEVLKADGRTVGICGELSSARRGPRFLLNATLDTAPFGDPQRWTFPPLSARTHRGWLYGRGSADSKAGVSIFCHVLSTLSREIVKRRGSVAFVFDVDEHSGGFGGIRRWFATRGRGRAFNGGMIGYPGQDQIVIGCRGFHRATLTVHGASAHSGSSRHRGINAVARAAALVEALQSTELPAASGDAFPLTPQITVTRIEGGDGFSSVPDRCLVDVDVRLTPAFTAAHAKALLSRAVRHLDERAETPRTEVKHIPGWPAYKLPVDAPVYVALRNAAQQVFGRTLPGAIVGPSSVANFLAVKGIGATSGFGVRYRNLHAPDECIEIASLDPAYQTYLAAARALLT